MRRKTRKWDDHHHDDPGAGLLNLFDVWIAFAAALLLAALSYGQVSAKPAAATSSSQASKNPDPVNKQRLALDRYRESRQTSGGDGERLGVAYRLKNGEVIYVPEAK